MVFIVLTIIQENIIPKKEHKYNKKNKKELPKVTIAIPAYNEEETLTETVNSVLTLEYPQDKLQIIIINDGSKDKTLQIAQHLSKKNPGRITLLNQQNQGKAKSLNNALDITTGKYFACLDADSTVEKKTLLHQINTLTNAPPNTGASTPILLIKNPQNTIQKLQAMEYLISAFIQRIMTTIDCLFVTQGPFSVYNTQIIKKIGGFSDKTVTEDQEIAYRLQANQYKITQSPQAKVYTNAPKTIKELYYQRKRWYYGGMQCLNNYKKLIFNPKYGDFGMFQLPLNLTFYLIAIIGITAVLYTNLKPLKTLWTTLTLTGFDIITHLKNITFNIDLLAINPIYILLSIISISIILLLLILSSKLAEQKITAKTITIFVPFTLLYYLIMQTFIVLTAIIVLTKKKTKWW